MWKIKDSNELGMARVSTKERDWEEHTWNTDQEYQVVEKGEER